MAFQIEFFQHTPRERLGEPMGPRLEGFSSRRAARIVAEHHHPDHADGFRIYDDGALLISIELQPKRAPMPKGPRGERARPT